MSDAPKLRLYAIAVSFSDGIGGMTMIPAITEAMAVAYAVQSALRSEPVPQGEVTHIMAKEVDPAFLRALLKAVETGQPSDTRVVPFLVPEPVAVLLAQDTQGKSDVRAVEMPEGPPAA